MVGINSNKGLYTTLKSRPLVPADKLKPSPRPLPQTTPWFLFALGLAFLFRLGFGLCSEIWFIDQQQIYLIGLKYYTTGLWPYFGPDVAPQIQLPGALQGLVVGLPLALWPIPEAPYLFLNLLSFAGLCSFAWYCSKRLPQFPQWIIYTWLLTAPWVMNWSTNIDNDSYVIFGSCFFFIGFLETLPALSLDLVSLPLACFMMGSALFWNAQFHMSYVVLFPFALAALALRWRLTPSLKMLPLGLSFLLGGLITESFVIPTYLKYGLAQGSGGALNAIAFNPENFKSFFNVLARFFALAACEIPRFIGANNVERFQFLSENPWIAPFAGIAGILGLAQLIVLIVSLFRKDHPQKDWAAVKYLALGTFFLIYLSFLFAIKPPAAHTYYLALPVAMLYGFYVFSPWASKRWFLKVAAILLACNILFHLGLALHNLPLKSLYKNRDLFTRAIAEKNYHLLGERREGTIY